MAPPASTTFPIPTSPSGAKPFQPKTIQHVRLTVKPSATGGLDFMLCEVPTDGFDPNDIEAYAREVDLNGGKPGKDCATYDITIGGQENLFIELDPKLNWQFCVGAAGVTMKEDYGGSNFGLVHVIAGAPGKQNTLETGGVATQDGCRAVYFGVYSRDGGKPPQGYNLHVQFFMPDGSTMKRMATVFDPDIKNDGGSFP